MMKLLELRPSRNRRKLYSTWIPRDCVVSSTYLECLDGEGEVTLVYHGDLTVVITGLSARDLVDAIEGGAEGATCCYASAVRLPTTASLSQSLQALLRSANGSEIEFFPQDGKP